VRVAGGVTVHGEIVAAPVRFADGDTVVDAVQVIVRDISERFTAVRALRESEERVRGAVEASLDALFILRAIRDAAGALDDFEIVDCNTQGAVFASATRDGLLGRSAGAVFREARKRGLLAACARVVATGEPYITEYRMDALDAPPAWAWLQVVRVGDGVAITARDITGQKHSEEALRALALVDELTGVYNRRGFLAAAEREWQRAQRERHGALLAYLDLNDFKGINDAYGHAEGDAALRALSEVLRAAFRGADVIGRLGGDEFAVLVVPTTNTGQAAADLGTIERMIRERLVHHLAASNATAAAAGRPYALSLSVGVARSQPRSLAADGPPSSLTALMIEADERLYEEKRLRSR
jgi:diguanylate cyclase (GGDEF)-like protein